MSGSRRLAVLAGDCLQNMRAALDHLAWQLAIRGGKKATPSRQTAFPICAAREEFRSKATKAKVGDLSAEDRARVENMQPYHILEPRTHWLWHLNELSRVDRHRVLHVIGGVQEAIGMKVGDRDEDGTFRLIPIAKFSLDMNVKYATFKDGAEVARFTLGAPYPDIDMSQVEMDCEFSFMVIFGEHAGPSAAFPVVDALGAMLLHISDHVVAPFVDSFGIVA